MDIVILGAGALGSIFATHLVAAGNQVTLVARGRRAAQLEQNGLSVSGLVNLRNRCAIVTDPLAVPGAGLLIVTVKTYDNESAIAALSDERFESVFSVANGVLKNTQLAKRFGPGPVLGCMADTSGELLDSGEVIFSRNVCLHLGELDGALSPRLRAVVRSINDSGIKSQAEPSIETIEWSKFVGWTALLVLAVTTRTTTGRFLADPNCALLGATMIREMAAIAAAKNIHIIDQSPLPVASIVSDSLNSGQQLLMEIGRQWIDNAPKHRLSALQDLERGKNIEIEETLGFAVQEAEKLGVDTPALANCYQLVAGINGTIVTRR